MAQFATENIRTVALVGHGASGKTTLAEALLVEGRRDRGRRQRRARHDRQRLRSAGEDLPAFAARVAAASRDRRTRAIHLIDTPGYPDFIGQAIGALDAVETAAVVINAAAGIEMITSRMMEWAATRKLCRLVIVNKIDAENVDLPGAARGRSRPRSARSACRSTCRPTAASASSTASSIPPATPISRRSPTRTGRSSTRSSRSTRS